MAALGCRHSKAWCSASAILKYCLIAACGLPWLYHRIPFFNNHHHTFESYNIDMMDHSTRLFHLKRRDTASDNREESASSSQACILPELIPNDPQIAQYIKRPDDIPKCPKHDQALLISNTTHIWLNKHNLKYYGTVGKEEHVRCCYRAFHPSVNDTIEHEPCIVFNDVIKVLHEFVQVDCYNITNRIIDKQHFAFAFKKSTAVTSSKNVHSNNSYSILILGIDTVSRMNFHRTMPKTLSYLIDEGAVELSGYNKIGYNTFPNLVAMLLGLTVSELENTCWPTWKTPFDKCPFIWNTFRDKGYLTAFAEDNGAVGTFHYNGRKGFVSAPTDYYLHPFTMKAEDSKFKSFSLPYKKFAYNPCKGNQYFFDVLLDYVKSLIFAVHPSKLFAVFWEATMSHDDLNYPAIMDSSYVKLFQTLDDGNYLSNTIIFLVSDHGLKFGAFRTTRQGRLEENLPFLYILTPKSFRERYNKAFENLKLNSERLTTPIDLHATLKDLADIYSISNSAIVNRSKESYSSKKGISLFLPIPKNRTCKSAAIEDHWCTCYTENNIPPPSAKDVQEAANYVVSHINHLVSKNRNCAHLNLSRVLNGTEMTVDLKAKTNSRAFLVVVQTTPGNGVFEAKVQKDIDTSALGRHKHSISATISRLNLYYKQSRCVDEPLIKPYCYCK